LIFNPFRITGNVCYKRKLTVVTDVFQTITSTHLLITETQT